MAYVPIPILKLKKVPGLTLFMILNYGTLNFVLLLVAETQSFRSHSRSWKRKQRSWKWRKKNWKI